MAAPALTSRLSIALTAALTIGLLGAAPAHADDAPPAAQTTTAATTDATTTETALVPGTARISGAARVGAPLRAITGSWPTGTALSYQWRADGAPISRATASTFTPTASHSGKAISVSITGTRAGAESATVTSPQTLRVMRWSTPKISGAIAAGFTLTAVPGTWTTGTSFSYRWYANGVAIPGATKKTFALGAAQKGKRITVAVTGAKSGHTTHTQKSSATAKVATASAPKISGTAVVGSKLTAKHGAWTSGTTLAYRWYANGVPIPKAIGKTFTVTTAQYGKAITFKMAGTKAGYAKVTLSSKATTKVPRTATPTISGNRTVSSVLTAKPGTWSKATTFSYRWYADGKAIKNATSSKLRLTSALKGKRITVKVAGKKAGYTTVTRTSKATAKVAYPSRTRPSNTWDCPSWAPIKGNASSMIYHVPGGAYYSRTKPEECFSTRSAAERAGYRASMR